MRPVIIFGSGGMLGTDLVAAWKRLQDAGPGVLPPLVEVADWNVVEITDPQAVDTFIGRHHPQWVINCAAYTDVEGCTRNPDLAMKVNGHAAGYIAAGCARAGAGLTHISTDFVFDGESRRPYFENDFPRPLSVYGQSKLAGEQAVRAYLPLACIIRTAWLYGAAGKNFVATMLRLARERDRLRVVNDQTGCPTYTADLAEAIIHLFRVRAQGIVHVVNGGQCTWYELASSAIRLAGLSTPIVPITAAEFGSPTPRPAYSVLSTVRYTSLTGRVMRPWDIALREFIGRHGARRNPSAV